MPSSFVVPVFSMSYFPSDHRSIINRRIRKQTQQHPQRQQQSSLIVDSYGRMASSGVHQHQHQHQQSDGMKYGSSCQHQHGVSMGETTCRATPIHAEVLAEIATSGARAPIHFVEESAAFHGFSRSSPSYRPSPSSRSSTRREPELWRDSRDALSSPAVIDQQQVVVAQHAVIGQQPVATSLANVSSCINSSSSGKHHRRTSTPLDGAYLTLLGVSTGLKTPGVDHWAVAGALIESSVDLRTRNAKGMTPLHLACASGQVRQQRRVNSIGLISHLFFLQGCV